MKRILLTAAVAASLTTGCATMSPEQCMVADWYGLGEQDAMAGRSSNYLADRAGACQEAGFDANTEDWYAGFESALPMFCTLDNGFKFGIEGNTYRDTCPPRLESTFDEGYEFGYEIYQLEQAVATSRRRMNYLRAEIDREQDRQMERQEEGVSVDLSRLSDLRDELTDKMEEVSELEVELATVRGVAIGQGFNVPR